MKIATTKGLQDTDNLEGQDFDKPADALIEAVKQFYSRRDGKTLNSDEVKAEVSKIIDRRVS